jgi:hypothetical protein
VKYIGVVAGMAAAITIGVTVAVAGRSATIAFELVNSGVHEQVPESPDFPYGIRHRGTFTAGPPFCSSGTFVDLTNDLLLSSRDSRLYTCADGSGTLTVGLEEWYEHKPPFVDVWHIESGTGRYAELRGRGSLHGEFLSGDPEVPITIVFRSTLRGSAALDSIAPMITVSTAKATKLRRPAGAYAIRAAFSVRDNEPQDALSYLVAAEPLAGGLYLAQKKGSTSTGKVAVTLRVIPPAGAKRIKLNLRAEDPVGNWRWVERLVKLPH